MRYNLSVHDVVVTDDDRILLDKKLERLERRLSPPFVTDIRLTRDAHHQTGDVITCAINIEYGKRVLHTKRSAATIQDALDECLIALKKELEKLKPEYRTKPTS